MPRQPRVATVVPGLPHHVILRGNNQRRLFSFDPERMLFLALLGDALARFEMSLHALVLMTNHVHLVTSAVRSVDALSTMVKRFAQRYAQERNRRRQSSGKLFEARFDAFAIDSVAYLAAATAYTELNPELAGMRRAHEYPWSTYGFHAGSPEVSKIPRAIWAPSPWYLALGETEESRAARYVQFFELRREAHQYSAKIEIPWPVRRVRRPDGSSAR